MHRSSREVWVFGYGSLMWRPGFAYVEAHHARLEGYHRAFCIYSIHYRGSERRPGLVLGLDRGGSCEGIAFRLDVASAAETLAYLRRRELVYGVYQERRLPVSLLGTTEFGGVTPVLATTFVAERAHPAYSGVLPLRRQVELIRGARGRAGTNLDYAVSTLTHLEGLNIRDRRLTRVVVAAGAFSTRGDTEGGMRPRAVARWRIWSRKPLKRPVIVRDNRFSFRGKLRRDCDDD